MKAGEIYDFLRHPIQYIVHHSKDYKRLVSDKEVITSENKTLISKTNKLTSENQNLFEEVDSLEKIVNSQESQLISKSKQIIKLQEDNAYVQRDREDAIKNLLSIKLDVENALEVCHHVKTAEDVILARAKENKSDNRAFNEWIEIPKHQAEDGKRTAEERAVIYEGHAFGGRVNCFINQNPIARKEAITFYDFANKKFYYNNEALNLLGINARDSYMSLNQLLRVIKEDKYTPKGKEPVSVRRYLFSSLKEGNPLDSFEIHTERKSKFYLTTRPIEYLSKRGNVTHKKSFGILMFFDTPSLLKFNRAAKEYKNVENILGLLNEDFKDIYKAIENIKA